MNDINIDAMLGRMRALAQAASGEQSATPGGTPRADFSTLLRDLIGQVNDAQQGAARAAQSFDLEEPGVDIVQTVIASQKSRLAFEALLSELSAEGIDYIRPPEPDG